MDVVVAAFVVVVVVDVAAAVVNVVQCPSLEVKPPCCTTPRY